MNSDNNCWILSEVEVDLYLMIIYLCMKYESNTPNHPKDTVQKAFVVRIRQDIQDKQTRVMLYAPPPN